ncbi:MAG: alpha-amylase family glycosyl hydrolase [Nostoc sp. DedVER02]|uniref:alpha-amylase family glycosyl hydrolase n=1 Tax=unclassified Nostoc TaxID=2593658 RepID=UPI002AD3BA88|nr:MULTISPECIES: alpha-amylase family glycosyl hydrolase [unclassified Nostoc]MDZ7988940.1 alpha-amylase family glycosyl hydrolase [Nostoc sp. DedVER02]MDZ8114734.1 alpha-amylase family glycosyl hydrolase [Nostoc sp. DedVER01b]
MSATISSKTRDSLTIMYLMKTIFICTVGICTICIYPIKTLAAEKPTAIFHAFDQQYSDLEKLVCKIGKQGYSHIQISPGQKSNPAPEWWARYQPVDYSIIEGRGSLLNLKKLISQAHSCNVKVIADVVFNHMANLDGNDEFEDLTKFPGLFLSDFNSDSTHPGQKSCSINYSDGNRDSEINCWLGGLPDLRFTNNVKKIQKAHLKKLLSLGIDGFRFDAAKHLPADVVKEYISYVKQQSQGKAWNYVEVIIDRDTSAEDYNWIAAVTDFALYNSIKNAFSFGGDLRSLRVTTGINDSHSVTFGRNHDTIREINSNAINPYSDPFDSYLATAYVLARESGTPLILNWDNRDSSFIKYGVKFRQIMHQRGNQGKNIKENILTGIDSPTVLLMERGSEGFFVVNKGENKFNIPVLDLTLTNLDGCYRELRNNFTVAIEHREQGKKFITRWISWNRGGMEVQKRDALYFIREPFNQCQV